MGLLSQTLSSGRWATNSRFSDCVWPFAEEECKRSTISLKAGCFTLIPGAAPVSAGSQVRNSFSDSCDVTVKTGADLAMTRKSQVTFAAFNSNKITVRERTNMPLMNVELLKLGLRIRASRKILGLSQKDFSKESGLVLRVKSR